MFVELEQHPGFRFEVTEDLAPSDEALDISAELGEPIWFISTEVYDLEAQTWEEYGTIIGDIIAPTEQEAVEYIVEDLLV